MVPMHVRLRSLPLLTAAVAVVTIISLGGCPVAQQPTTPPADDGANAGQTGFLPNNNRSDTRPIPPLPVDDGQDQSGLDGGTLPEFPGAPGDPGQPDDGDEPDDGPSLRVTILGPNTNLEVRRDEPVEVEYRVDGDAANIELLFDLEGGQAGLVAQGGLNVEGTVLFSTAQPGVYTLSIRAATADGEVVQTVPGKVTVVGDMAVSFSKPAQDLIVRPNVPVQVAYTVDTLASSINAEVFVDPDTSVEGDETRVLSSILKSVNETFNTQGLLLGVDYAIFVQVTDSLGQESGRIQAVSKFRIVPVPTILVTGPIGDETIEAGDPVRVDFVGFDTEGIATITVFVDTDGVFNGDEDALVSGLPISETSYVVDTSDLIAGSYHFGAWVSDPDTGDIFNHDYATGVRTIPGINITAPTGDTTLRTPNTVEMRWTATYPPAAFQAHEVVIGEDFDNDGVPDGSLQMLADGFSPGANTVQVSTIGLKGRYLLGVRLTDLNDESIVRFATGDMIVLNDAPTVQINQPDDFLAVRPGTAESQIRMNFLIGDTENQTSLLDIAVVVARDDDGDGVPDGDPVIWNRDSSFRIGLNSNYIFDADQVEAFINDSEHDGWGFFVLGVQVTDDAGQTAVAWTPGLYVDNVVPAIVLDEPAADLTIKDHIGTLDVQITVSDTSYTAVRVLMDRELNPNNNFDGFELVPWTIFEPNETRQFVIDLTDAEIPSGYFLYYLQVADGPGITQHYLPEGVTDPRTARALWIRDRLIGIIEVDSFADSPDGAILQGVNFNDLGGSSMARVPDVDNDGDDEFIIGSRYGKPFLIGNDIGVGFGEAVLIYGNDGNNNINEPRRLRGTQTLNAVGRGDIIGLAFSGIRIPLNATAETTGMTEGLSDVTVVPDMDGDDLPEFVFSFPRAESINLGTTDPRFQHPELLPDISNMGNLEYNALDPIAGWIPNTAQFTRGGVVMVSSHNSGITNENAVNRKFDRVIDLHEIGQMFTSMSRPSLVPYVIGAEFNGIKSTRDLGGQTLYVLSDCGSGFEDISDTGELLELEDDDGEFVLFGFTFTFYDVPQIEAGVSSNGYLTFGDTIDDPNNAAIPDGREPNNLIAGLWTDLNPEEGGEIFVETRGSPGSQRFIAQWTDVPRSGEGDANTFQVILFESDNSIEIRFRTGTPQPDATDTIGIENPTGDDGVAIDPGTINPVDEDVCRRIELETQEGCDFDGDGVVTPDEQILYQSWTVFWDTVFTNQGPGGFHMPWTEVSANPPLANPSSAIPPGMPPYIFYPDRIIEDCFPFPSIPDLPCEWASVPFVWPPQPFGPFPCSRRNDIIMWDVGGSGISHWTGFYGPAVSIRDFNVGARLLGQVVNDRFGTAVASDGTWLYISAPRHTALVSDVPLLPDARGNRFRSGVVYQYRIDTRSSPGAPTRSQLWMEPGTVWPDVDAEGVKPADTTMPVPHQYIIESVGSVRGGANDISSYNFNTNGCPPAFSAVGSTQASAAAGCYQPYAVGTVGYYVDRTPQIIGPHVNSQISFVRGVGDINDDGIEDFAVGSTEIRDDFSDPQNPSGPKVGGIFIIYSRSAGLEGDYLLEDVARSPGDQTRLNGVLIKGEAPDEAIARVFDGVGDFNGDGVDDVIVGSQNGSGGRGEAILIFGSRTLTSPEGGFRLSEIVDQNRAIRFIGAAVGDLAGANVAGIGDVDFDGIGDILIAAPKADPLGSNDEPGAVYLIYGSVAYQDGQVIDLSLVGTPEVPGVVFVGRHPGDFMGGGEVVLTVNPDLEPTRSFSRGVAAIGDIDGDGRADYAISAMLADVGEPGFQKTDAGEIYVIYGRGDHPAFAP